MLIHGAFHNQTHVGLSCVSLVLTLAVKEMLYLKIQTIIPHDPYICQFIYNKLPKSNIQQNSNFRYFLAVNRKVKVRPLIITYSIKVKVHNIASSVQGDPVCLLRIGIDND